jgi:hypothetical protein
MTFSESDFRGEGARVIDSVKNGNDDDIRDDTKQHEAGDVVEEAGETTAADTITGPTNPKPVGADTMLKVSDESAQKG